MSDRQRSKQTEDKIIGNKETRSFAQGRVSVNKVLQRISRPNENFSFSSDESSSRDNDKNPIKRAINENKYENIASDSKSKIHDVIHEYNNDENDTNENRTVIKYNKSTKDRKILLRKKQLFEQ